MTEPEKFGSYLVYDLLGTGGMATVHLAETQSAGGFRKRVALKRLLGHLMEQPDIVESFTREAKLASHLHHANIAQMYDLGMIDGRYFIAMELVPGPTLRQIVKQCADAAGAIPIEHTLDILTQICEALDYAHNLADDAGKPLEIVHRDVSPANIIVPASGVVKLIDFGLAKVKSGRGTKDGILKGKLGYMAPEYTLGRLDARADLFAVGVIAHELLTGRRLFDHESDYEIIQMLREMPIQPPSRWNPAVVHDLDDIVMTALQRNPGNRWQSAAALHAALLNFAREYGFALAHTALGKWTEWAFTQQPRQEASGLARVIDMLEDPSDTSIERAISDASAEQSGLLPVAPELTPATVMRQVPRELTPATVQRPVPAELIAAATSAAGKPSTNPPSAPRKPTTKPPSIPRAGVNPAPSISGPRAGVNPAPSISGPRAGVNPAPSISGPRAGVNPAPSISGPRAGVNPAPSISGPSISGTSATKRITKPPSIPPATKPITIPPPSAASKPLDLGSTHDRLPALAKRRLDQATDVATTVKVPEAPRSARWPFLLVLLIIVAAGAAVGWHFGVIRFPR